MKTSLYTLIFCLSLSAAAYGQDTTPARAAKPADRTEAPKVSTRTEKEKDDPPPVPTGAYVRPNRDERLKQYVNNTIGPLALARTATSAGVATWRNSPDEWGKDWEGFGRRFASGLGRGAIKNTTVYALDETLKLDSRFYRSKKKDFGGRLGDALLSTVTARRPDGTRTVGVPRLAGTYAASVIASETWFPKRYDYKDGLRSGTISLGINAGFNVIKEFFWKK